VYILIIIESRLKGGDIKGAGRGQGGVLTLIGMLNLLETGTQLELGNESGPNWGGFCVWLV